MSPEIRVRVRMRVRVRVDSMTDWSDLRSIILQL